MGIAADITEDWHAALAALAWQVDLGVTEVLGEGPVNRYDLPDAAPAMPLPARAVAMAAAVGGSPVPAGAGIDALALAEQAAAACADLETLREALQAFDLCDLKKGARNLVFADGNPAARLMVIGEAPGRDEDYEGRPFVGRAGQLLDRMLAAIGLDRTAEDPARAAYITNVMPWRPPGNRDPSPEEIAMMRPFVLRHIALVRPAVVIATGNTSCAALLGQRGILRLRGHWGTLSGQTGGPATPVMPITHPAYLLRNPAAKREAWADLLAVQARLRDAPQNDQAKGPLQ